MPETIPAYNEPHAARPFTKGKRRTSVYVSWSYPGEANREITGLDNRFSTMNEVRRVGWPVFEAPRYSDPRQFQQGIAGTLELFFEAWELFQGVVGTCMAAGLVKGEGFAVEPLMNIPASIKLVERMTPLGCRAE